MDKGVIKGQGEIHLGEKGCFREPPRTINKFSSEIEHTPPISRRLRPYAKDYEETLKEKVKKQEINGSIKWVFKAEMKVVNDQQLCMRMNMKKDLTLSKVKAYCKGT